jgi:translation initiation factor RLI1
VTLAELLADEFGTDWDNLTSDQQQVLVNDVEGIRGEDGLNDTEAVKTLARRIKSATLDSYVVTLMIEARPHKIQIRCKGGCKQIYTVEVSRSGFRNWQGGMLIQKALPELNADQRELLISQTCGSCWEKLFGGEE